MSDCIWNKPELVVAIAAAFISLVSLGVAIAAMRVQRMHNYLSVKPIAHFSRGDYEDSVFVKLKNYGTGPMLIESFTVFCEHGALKRMIDAFADLAEQITWDTFTDTIDGRALAPGKEFVLLKATFGAGQVEIKNQIRLTLSKMTLRLTYKDVYDRKQPVVSEELKWFARK